MIIITEKNDSITDDTLIYMGSHNFTPAAWGRVEVI
jgi:hypothetical protein